MKHTPCAQNLKQHVNSFTILYKCTTANMYSMKCMMLTLYPTEDGRMSCSLPRLDLESSRSSYNSHSRYSHGERHDSMSSGGGHDSPHSTGSGREMDHVLAKHRAMANQQTPLSRRMAEEKEGKTRRDSFSVSFDWNSLPSSQASTQSAPCSTVASPLSGQHDNEDADEEGEKREGAFQSTLTGSDSYEPSEGPQFPLGRCDEHGGELGGSEVSLTSTPVPSHHRTKGHQLSSTEGFKFGGSGLKATPTKRERGSECIYKV